jgi:hypothetical protein
VCAIGGTRPFEKPRRFVGITTADSLHIRALMERNLVDEDRPRNIASQFELFVAKLMESWIVAGTVQVSAGDMKMAADFLRQVGFQVEEVAGLMVKLRSKDGRTREMTREDAMLFAVRCLTGQDEPAS